MSNMKKTCEEYPVCSCCGKEKHVLDGADGHLDFGDRMLCGLQDLSKDFQEEKGSGAGGRGSILA